MRRLVLTAFLLALVTWFSPPTFAQPTKSARGTVTAVAGDVVTVKVGAGEMKFTVDAKTDIITEGGSTATRAAAAKGKAGVALSEMVKVGQAVEVRYHETGSTMHAAEIRRVSTTGAGGGSTSDQREAAKAMTANGTVESVTTTALTITGAGGGGATFRQSYTLDATTKVVGEGVGTAAAKAGGKVVLTDFVGKGDRVTVTYHQAGTGLHASEVRVERKAGK
jgi:hypothetical protein